MKILIVANNCKWASWPQKIQALKDWFAPKIHLDIDLEHTNYQNVPFDGVNYNENLGMLGINKIWYDAHVTSMAVNHQIVLFVMNDIDWNGLGARGWRTDRDDGPIELQIGAGENELNHFIVSGYSEPQLLPAFFQYARHELCHAFYMITGGTDRTHEYWNQGKLELCLNDFFEPEIKQKETIWLLTVVVRKLKEIFNILTQ